MYEYLQCKQTKRKILDEWKLVVPATKAKNMNKKELCKKHVRDLRCNEQLLDNERRSSWPLMSK